MSPLWGFRVGFTPFAIHIPPRWGFKQHLNLTPSNLGYISISVISAYRIQLTTRPKHGIRKQAQKHLNLKISLMTERGVEDAPTVMDARPCYRFRVFFSFSVNSNVVSFAMEGFL